MKTQLNVTKICGIALCITGLLIMIFPLWDSRLLFWGLAVLFGLTCLWKMFVLIQRPNLMTLIEGIACALLMIMLLVHPSLEGILIPLLGGIYLSIIAFFLFVQCVLDLDEKAWRTFFHDLLLMLVYLIPAVLMLYFRDTDVRILMVLAGIYLIVQGVQLIWEYRTDTLKHQLMRFVFRDWISLPVGFVSFLPGIADTLIRKGKWKKDPTVYDGRKNDQEVNFRVYIHAGLKSEALIGHMTFSYQNVMYSYGDYDRAAEKWFHTMGPGVVFTVNPEIYCNNSCIYEATDIYEFGLHLTPEQEQKLIEVLQKRFSLLYTWKCPLEKQPDPAKVFKEYDHVYCNRLWYRTRCHFYKFKDSKWKWYFIVGMNCSLYAEQLLSQIGANIIHKDGIVSPGEYLDYFESEYADPASNVITRSWHSAAYPQTLFDVPAPNNIQAAIEKDDEQGINA